MLTKERKWSHIKSQLKPPKVGGSSGGETRRNKEQRHKYKTIIYIRYNPIISITSLNVNDLNTPV